MSSTRKCPTGKVKHPTYAEALIALGRLADPERGCVYTCQICGEFHVSSRQFFVVKHRGRGGARRGVMF
jgi:hypothetical protein